MNVAKVFQSGSDRAIRLPDEFRVNVDEVQFRPIPEGFLAIPHDPWKVFYGGVEELSEGFFCKMPRTTSGRGTGLEAMSDLLGAGTMIFIIRVLKCVLLTLAFAGRLSFGGEDKPLVSEATQRVALTAGQARAIALLCQSRPEKPAPLFLFTDPNKDPDD